MNAAIVDDIDRMDFIPLKFQNSANSVADSHIPQMAEMERFVSIGSAIFYHNIFFIFSFSEIVFFFKDGGNNFFGNDFRFEEKVQIGASDLNLGNEFGKLNLLF